MPPLLHEHIEPLTAALERLGEQLTRVGGDPLLANAHTDGAVRKGDLTNLVKWWQDGRIAQLLARVLGLAVSAQGRERGSTGMANTAASGAWFVQGSCSVQCALHSA